MSRVFAWAHGDAAVRAKVPPFLLFDKPGTGRDVRFRGLLAVPELPGPVHCPEDPSVTRAWIDQPIAGQPLGSHRPAAWRVWVERGTYDPLLGPPTVIVRPRDQQQPAPADRRLLDLVYQHFKDCPHDFEQFAADLWRVSESNVDKIDVTRPWRDGGRGAETGPMPTAR